MLIKGAFLATAMTVGVAVSAGHMAWNTDYLPLGNPDIGPTLSQAPIWLGNPAAAATLATRLPETPETPAFESTTYTQDFPLKKGETLAGLLNRVGVNSGDITALLSPLAKAHDLRRMQAGENVSLDFRTRPDDVSSGNFLGLSLRLGKTHLITAYRDTDGDFAVRKVERALTRSNAVSQGTINLSLYLAGQDAGLPMSVLAELIRVYSWDVDFQRDIRKGDQFEALYERFDDEKGELSHTGAILHAAMTLSGKRYPIYLHTLADGTTDYFDDAGRSAKKALMRTPIDGARLSSGFGKRKHPILGYTKMHRGADFAAAAGTPIYAAGNGTVEVAGWNGAYGKYVRIRHNSEYSTAYAHMSRIKTAKGRRVTQGEVIGYVGTTGRSTGAHLHYEILKAGIQTNPMKVRMPSGRKLAGEELARFQNTKATIQKVYAEALGNTELAEAK